MKKTCGIAAMIFGMLAVAATGAVPGNDDAAAANPSVPRSTMPALDRAQREAVGVGVRRPALVTIPARTPAMGLVLDPSRLVREFGDMNAAEAEEHAAAAERNRLHGLYGGGAGARRKMLQAARARPPPPTQAGAAGRRPRGGG